MNPLAIDHFIKKKIKRLAAKELSYHFGACADLPLIFWREVYYSHTTVYLYSYTIFWSK